MHRIFKDRREAGQVLAERLAHLRGTRALVLALPRGGVPVGAEVARALHAPLDTLVVRKLGAKGNPEYGIGAIAPETVIIDDVRVADAGMSSEDVRRVAASERAELERRVRAYRSGSFSQDVSPDTVVIVDDGVATGVSARAAVESARKMYPNAHIAFTAPVGSQESANMLRAIADDVLILETPMDFSSVGEWYESFPQTSDEEVLRSLLEAARAASPPASRS